MRRGVHSIHNRLFVLFLVCMLSLLLVVSGLYYKRTTDQFHDKIGDIARKNVSQTMDLFDLLLKGYDSLTKSLNGNPDLQRLLSEPAQDTALRMINERTITNMIGAIYYSREDMIGIHVITQSGAIYSYGNMMSVIDPDYAQSEWYKQVSRSRGEMVWLGAHPRSLIDRQETRPVFTFGRLLYDLHEYKPIGVVLIETDPKPIMSGLSNMGLGPHSEVAIVTKDGRVVASTTASSGQFPGIAAELPAAAEGQVEVVTRPGTLVVASKPAAADWQVVSVTPDTDLNVELDQMKHFLLLVGSVLIVVSTALATFVSRTISAPFKRLIHQMRQVERGHFQGVVQVNSYEEINILVGSFNQMVRRMDELIERVKAVSASEKHAQLQALQSQVNPHFLYNTLDMIYWMLDERGNERLCRVVLALSRMFQYSSRWDGSSEVTLGEELEQIGHYLTIIETRLDGRLTVEVNVPAQWHAIRLPKMTLQPLIENAVKYGLEPLGRPGKLRVCAERQGGLLRLCVEDDGAGIAPATLRAIERELGSYGRLAAEAGPAQGGAAAALPLHKAAVNASAADGVGRQGEPAAAPEPAPSAERSGESAGLHRAAGSSAPPGEAAAPQRYAQGQPPAAAMQTAAAAEAAAAVEPRAGIGLGNVHRRLRLMFGESGGLQVRSVYGKGTAVVISMPTVTEAEEEGRQA